MSIVRMDYRGRSEWTIVEAGFFCRDSATICSLPTCGGTRVLLVVPDLREILSGTKRATLGLISGAGRCGVRVVGKRVQE